MVKLILIAFALSSCIPSSESTPTPTQPSTLVVTEAPDKTIPDNFNSSDDLPEGIPDLIEQDPTVVIEPKNGYPATETPVEEDKLSETGPWFIFSNPEEFVFVVDKDGAAISPLTINSEVLQSDIYDVSNSYPLLAVVHAGGSSIEATVLSIVKLPNFEEIERIDLASCSENIQGCEVSEEVNLFSQPLWSPNGRYLAFLGAIDGPSLDLYVYDAQWGKVRQVSSGPNHVGSFLWSPDSRWIVHEEIQGSWTEGWIVESIWAAPVSGCSVKWLFSPKAGHYSQEVLGWVNDDQFIVKESSWDGTRNLRLISIENGIGMTLFPGYFLYPPVLAPETGTVAFFPLSGAPNTPLEMSGIYIVSTISSTPQKIAIDGINVKAWLPEEGYFLTDVPCDSVEGGYLGFRSSGEVSCIEYSDRLEFLSPNEAYIAIIDSGLEIYNSLGEFIGLFPKLKSGKIIWRPDSEGFFIASQGSLFYISIPDIEWKLMYEGIGTESYYGYNYQFAGLQWVDNH